MVNIRRPGAALSDPAPTIERTHRLKKQSSVHAVEIEHRRPDFCSRSLMGKECGKGVRLRV